jgi:pentatricopeptide repeat protein
MKPDHITFIGVLSACNQEGLVNKGREYFHSMSQDYGIIPRVEHYACMVDLLGHVGCLDEAENLIKEMPLECGSMVWRTLLVACRVHGNMEMGKRVAKNIMEMEPEEPTTYGILSTIHTIVGRWEDVAKVQELMKDRGVKMEPGQSWIEIKSRVHKFVARGFS